MTKVTQQQIADTFGVNQKMVSRWKQQGAPMDDLLALCKWIRLHRQRMPKELKQGIERIEKQAGILKNPAPSITQNV